MNKKSSKKDQKLMFYGILIALLAMVGIFFLAFNSLKDSNDYSDNKTSGYCIENNIWNLKDCILATNGGNEEIESKEVDFISVFSESGMYSDEDSYGTTYYYRGDKSSLKNNLIFAGFQWKIVRVNGDESIRLIYNGLCLDNSCEINSLGKDTVLGMESFFSGEGLYNDIKYLKYKDIEDSYIKAQLDAWYALAIKTQGDLVEEKIADSLFCNEIGNERLATLNSPTFKCSKENSYTVSDAESGNISLNYSVGLISADEIIFAGGKYGNENENGYLSNGLNYWSMTPQYFDQEVALMFGVNDRGKLVGYRSDEMLYIRPVISLKVSTLLSYGDGSTENPFIVN